MEGFSHIASTNKMLFAYYVFSYSDAVYNASIKDVAAKSVKNGLPKRLNFYSLQEFIISFLQKMLQPA